ncbi:GAF domain-containing hybrid sensor histidine kinase/response regulator [Methylobacterium sp. WSM2598]|uniref:GAF domain-containing hybrid sensor histidine kinase/response regulator n=1 Tax=Methylobacterium sp. WSM2598 TaxID=398261 RepID=UPI00035D1C8F|nr:PAS domain S-box protein [Methylobacterium sp. WSM2598]
MNACSLPPEPPDHPFIPGGSELGALVRAHDWAATPLGPLETWPQSLRTAVGIVLLSPVPIVMLWGEDGIMIYNDAYSVFAGGRHPQLLGSKVREGWPEVADFNDHVMKVGLSGGTLAYKNQELTLHRYGRPEQVWMDLDYSPILDERGRPAGVVAIVVETSERVRAERREAFLAGLADALRDLADPLAVREAATRSLGLHLGADRVGYGEVSDADGAPRLTIAQDWCAQGVASIAGQHDMTRYASAFLADFLAGRTVVFEDMRSDPRTAGQSSEAAHARLAVRAQIVVPLVKAGRLSAVLFVHSVEARPWSADDVSLVGEVAERTWAAVERARAERMVQERNARLEILAEAIERAPAARTLGELMEIVGAAARRLSGADGVTVVLRRGEQCFYAIEDAVQPLWKGRRFPLVSCISGWAMLNRRTAIVADVRADSRVPQDLYTPTFVRSLVMVPILADGEATAAIGAYWPEVHRPPEGEVATLEALARTAGAVLRRLDAEEALRRLNETLETQVAERTADRDRMWRLSTDVMLVARFDATITAVNPAWTTLFGWREDDLVGGRFTDFVHPEDREATREEVGRLSEGLTTLRFVNRYRHRDGSYRWLSWTAVPDEGLIHAVGRDITVQRAQGEALAKTEEALRQAQKMEAVGQLTGGLAHDFNNLLTGIAGSLELLQTRVAQGRTGELDRYIEAAQGAAKRAAALTHRLLAFSRRQTLAPKPTDVNRLVAGMEELIRRSIGPAIALEILAGDGLWPILVDPSQLENALLNLCINARDAMPDGGRITIETSNAWLDEEAARPLDVPAGEYLLLCVTDTGTGMPPDVMTKVFDPFFTTKPLGEGTGLGLSMIYGFVRQSGGQVRIASTLGQGTTMGLYLPRHRGEAEAPEASPALAVAPRAGQGETVLIVDDEPSVRMLVTEVLEDLGYVAIEAADGPSGLKVLQSGARIDLLITDVGLPGGMNGRQVADAARVTRPDLRVLFITGYAESAAIGRGLQEAGMAILTKPFVMDTLASRIKDLISGQG